MKDHPVFPKWKESINAMEKGQKTFIPDGGLTLRQWYAGVALSGYLAWDAIKNTPETRTEFADVAKACFGLADAMLLHTQTEEPKEGKEFK